VEYWNSWESRIRRNSSRKKSDTSINRRGRAGKSEKSSQDREGLSLKCNKKDIEGISQRTNNKNIGSHGTIPSVGKDFKTGKMKNADET
jgi:hypothetical protein